MEELIFFVKNFPLNFKIHIKVLVSQQRLSVLNNRFIIFIGFHCCCILFFSLVIIFFFLFIGLIKIDLPTFHVLIGIFLLMCASLWDFHEWPRINSNKLLVDKIFHDDLISFDLFLWFYLKVFQLVSWLWVLELPVHIIHECLELLDLFLCWMRLNTSMNFFWLVTSVLISS